jgi:hypothetical protein
MIKQVFCLLCESLQHVKFGACACMEVVHVQISYSVSLDQSFTQPFHPLEQCEPCRSSGGQLWPN